MKIVSHVCAEFHNAKGEILFTVTPDIRNTFIEAPESIRQDPLYRMLVAEGSLEAGFTIERITALEHNPESGIDGTGKLMYPLANEQETTRGTSSAGEAESARKSAKAARTSKSAKEDPEPKEEATTAEPVPDSVPG